MYRLMLLLLTITTLSCTKQAANPEQIVFDRIAYVYSLKPGIAKDIWPGFDEKLYDVPLVYYTDSTSFIANPTDKFLRLYNPTLVFQNSAIQVYKTTTRLDSVPFHMAVNFTFGDTAAYDDYAPFMHCSSLEETGKVVQDVTSTETWVTMVIHEYFHGFQFQHKDYLTHFADSIAGFQKNKLQGLYKSDTWFKDKVDLENKLLLQALESDDRTEIKGLLATFFDVRKSRREKTAQKLNLDIEDAEKTYETLEGTARYVEQRLYEKFSRKQPDKHLLKADSAYHGYHAYKEYKLQNDEWLYLTAKSGTYFYATGFNMARLFDKLQVPYKERLFKEKELSLEDILSSI